MCAQFDGEETPSTYGYPGSYLIKPLAEQLAIASQVFPGLAGTTLSTPSSVLPAGAEGWFLLPRWESLAPTYNAGVELVLAAIARSRAVSFARMDRLGPEYLRRDARTTAMFDRLRHETDEAALIVPAQFGLRHRGRSIRRAREILADDEFGLGVFEVGCMLLAHPERLQQADQLYVDCPGDEYSASDEQQFSEAPFYRIIDDRVGFGTSWIGFVDPYFGSATAFMP